MFINNYRRRKANRRGAVVAVQVALILVVLIGFVALTVDIGVLYNTRADLQRAADAAALAGASAYTTDDMMRVRLETGGIDTLAYVIATAQMRAGHISRVNPSLGTASTMVEPGDTVAGWLNLDSSSEVIHPNPVPKDYNAVQVTVHKRSGDVEGENGPVQLHFASIFGMYFADVGASATAVFDDRVGGFNVSLDDTDVFPFTIHRDAFESELLSGGDQYAYDTDTDTISSGWDGIREIRLYPYPLSGSGYEEGDGNFGTLNIGTGNQGVDAEVVQILNGVPPSDFEMEIGTSDLTFFDEAGASVTYNITGSPGMESSLKDALGTTVGTVVGFFLHDNVILSGANATYTISEMRFGRVMDISLTGPPSQRGLFIQPVTYAGSGVRIDHNAPSTGGLLGRLILAR
ncbi:MAG: pilus assembly protein TadG-related protein [Planctomycetota bacterium]